MSEHESSYPIGNLRDRGGEVKWAPFCTGCKETWPCEASGLLAEMSRLRDGIADLLRAAEYRDSLSVGADFYGRPWRSPIAQEDLRALLDGDE